ALRIKAYLDRLGQQGIGGKEIYLEAVRHLERFPLDLRIGVRNLGIALSCQRTNGEQREQPGQPNEEYSAIHLFPSSFRDSPVWVLGFFSWLISASAFSMSGSNCGISRAFWPCSYLRKPKR